MFCCTGHQNIRLHTNSASLIEMNLQKWLDGVLKDESEFVVGAKHLCHASALKDAVKAQKLQVPRICSYITTSAPMKLNFTRQTTSKTNQMCSIGPGAKAQIRPVYTLTKAQGAHPNLRITITLLPIIFQVARQVIVEFAVMYLLTVVVYLYRPANLTCSPHRWKL